MLCWQNSREHPLTGKGWEEVMSQGLSGGNAGKEFAWLDEYLDKAVDLVFVVNSMSNKNVWRGAVLQVSLHQ